MARRLIKFPLKMENGAEVRSLEELRENADVESIMKYYFSGQLGLWCRAFGYTDFSEQLEDVNIEIIKSIYEKLAIPYKNDEAIEYLHDNHGFSVENIVGVADNTEETVVDNQEIKKKLAEYVDNDINLHDYSIEVTPVNDDNGKVIKYRVAIENEKTEQYSRFVLPYDVKSNYTQKNFEDDLYKKIAYVLKKKVEENDYLKLKNSRYAGLKIGDTFEFGEFDGKPIRWIVISKNNGELLSISENTICRREYGRIKEPSWEDSTLNKWLNKDFITASFRPEEKEMISPVNIDSCNSFFYILNQSEIYTYLSPLDIVSTSDNESYWVRTFSSGTYGLICASYGKVDSCSGQPAYKNYVGVRPAFWLKY